MAKNSKTAGIISYLWWIDLLIAFIMNHRERSTFTSFHIRQSIGLSILSFAIGLLTKYVHVTAGNILFVGCFILWCMGIWSAIKETTKEIPLLGAQFQAWFKNV